MIDIGTGENVKILPSFQESMNLYKKIIETFNEISCALNSKAEVNCELRSLIENVIELLHQDDRMLLGLAVTPISYTSNHISTSASPLSIHSCNVMIYSLTIAKFIGVRDNRLTYIGVAALLSRLDLLDEKADEINNIEDIAGTPLSTSVYQKYFDQLIFRDLDRNLIEPIATLAKQPDKKHAVSLDDSLYQYSMIIHICEVYASMTNPSLNKQVFSPIEAMRVIQDKMKDCFNRDVILIFFNKLSIYPIGSYVLLSTEQIAKIIRINDNCIMRPVVMVVLNRDGKEIKDKVVLNLRQKPLVHIKKMVTDDSLTKRFLSLY